MDEQSSSAHPIVLANVLEELRVFSSLFGLSVFRPVETEATSLVFAETALKFRQDVRELALRQIESGNFEAAQSTLALCDDFRSKLVSQYGIAVKVLFCWLWLPRINVGSSVQVGTELVRHVRPSMSMSMEDN